MLDLAKTLCPAGCRGAEGPALQLSSDSAAPPTEDPAAAHLQTNTWTQEKH